MNFDQALETVRLAAEQPKLEPTAEYAATRPHFQPANDPFSYVQWHDDLTEAQTIVIRWIWETCGQYLEVWETFEHSFLNNFNINHEVWTWAKVAYIAQTYLQARPNCDKKLAIMTIVGMTVSKEATSDIAKDVKRVCRKYGLMK